jgi:hypothetical protein
MVAQFQFQLLRFSISAVTASTRFGLGHTPPPKPERAVAGGAVPVAEEAPGDTFVRELINGNDRYYWD